MAKTPKISDASVRVLETLKILFKNNASIQDIINYFEKNDPNNRIYTNEVILKYINTFKVFGFRFIKNKDKYVLLNTFNNIEFNKEELEMLYFIENLSKQLPEERIQREINYFLSDLEKQFSNNTRILLHTISRNSDINLSTDYNKFSTIIKKYEKFCLDGLKLKVTYKNINSELSMIVEPNEIKYIGNEIYLSVYNPVSAQIQDININLILNIEQLPLKSTNPNMFASVTFMLKDRLAKSYKLHEGERVIQILQNDSIVVLNQKEDRNLLLKRLMRYGEFCEILSPKDLREEMKLLIKSTISNYL